MACPEGPEELAGRCGNEVIVHIFRGVEVVFLGGVGLAARPHTGVQHWDPVLSGVWLVHGQLGVGGAG